MTGTSGECTLTTQTEPNSCRHLHSWVQFIYGDRSAEMLSGPCTIDRQKKDSYLPPELWPHANDPNKSAHIVLTNLAKERAKEEHQQQLDSLGRRRFWLWDYLCIPLGDIRRHRGADAAQYLLCQQYLIYYLTLLSGICLLVLLPANVYGGTIEGDNFEKTTINALDSSSKMLWIHAVVTVLLVILVSIHIFSKKTLLAKYTFLCRVLW